MTVVSQLDHRGLLIRRSDNDSEAEDLLWSAGALCGRWTPREPAVSSLPQLSYARELLELQRRFGFVMTQRRRHGPGRQPIEPEGEHVHEHIELRVVLRGVLTLMLRVPSAGWLKVQVEPLEWLMLPAWLPHAVQPAPKGQPADLDLLCLYTQPGSWRARRLEADSASATADAQAFVGRVALPA